MPYAARKKGSRYAIQNTRTGRIVGYSKTKRKAAASARIRNAAHRPQRRRR